jgi:hypothetical protein
MRELENGWTHLISEVDGTGLAAAAEVRHAADKRAQRRVAVVAVAVAVALVATGVAAFGRPAPLPPGPTHPPSPTSTETAPSPTSSATPPAAPTSPPTSTPPEISFVPNSALLALPSDLRRDFSVFRSAPADRQVPALCHDPLAPDPTMIARKSRSISFAGRNEPESWGPLGILTETISVHRGSGAVDAMRRLRTELARCDERDDGDSKVAFATERAPRSGDDAVLIVETVFPPENTLPGPWKDRVAVIRIGDVVVVITVEGWEGAAVDRADVDLFVRLAAKAIDDWR